ncbi:HK97 gp10 family phage protein [Parvularcula flava]|uniref:HK97 gp10 family phage protein n=1 Tax=Aquisalinus luteolus TaxID=1566827 RepID=A0A8J3ES60_9PROT|nr:HK97 gp10 family phage protein [Aquisalinus luteolus]NHK29191.1 HK97 gp10 family phage protein [Aquisalinus luteolus]GGI00024.1 hypothetical protein GCM10011355_27340 [Aquisalinus luteolus]
MAQSFTAQIDEWVKETRLRAETVTKVAADKVFAGVTTPVAQGGRMRVDTGFLRSSFEVTLNVPVDAVRYKPEDVDRFTFDPGEITLSLAGFELGDTIYGVFTANYARYREYGANGQPPDAFVRTEVLQWQDYVNEAVREVRAAGL